MTVESGRVLLHYRLTEKLGEGGMGVVWRAVDTSLDRDVAIKILPDAFAQDAERLARFEREAKLLASLNHANIAGVYGLHQSDDTRFLAMELVEGEDLAERVARGPIPVDRTLDIAKQIVEALAAAHDNGIIHRDLKPANVRLTPDGTVKVLDFGLAKALDPVQASGETSATMSPTVTSLGTVAGVILGTAAYMSPEQAHGRPVDQRADLFALGCVLFEMLTGKLAFKGESVSDTIAAVLRSAPDLSTLPAETPPPLRRLLERCLAKDPRRRLHHAGDARLELEDAREWHGRPPEDAAQAAAARPARVWPFVAVALVVGLGLGAVVMNVVRRPVTTSEESPRVSFTVPIPDHSPLQSLMNTSFAISPDGKTIVYAAEQFGDEPGGIYRRSLDSFEAERLAELDSPRAPFFSPDGEWVAYFDEWGQMLHKVPVRGGPVVDITPIDSSGRGGHWADDGTILYSPSWYSGIWRVSSDGGESEPVTEVDADAGIRTHRMPFMLPGNRAFLFMIGDKSIESFDRASIAVHSLDTGETRILFEGGFDPAYLPAGYLTFARDGRLMAIRFDPDTLETEGNPVPILDGVVTGPSVGAAQVAFSANGTLVYMPGGPEVFYNRLSWFDRDGTETPFPIDEHIFTLVRFTSDGRDLLVRTDGANASIWSYDLARDVLTRVTTEWDNDFFVPLPGERMVYVEARGGVQRLLMRALDGSAPVEVLLESRAFIEPTTVSPDGRWLLMGQFVEGRGTDLRMVDLDGDTAPSDFIATAFNERQAAFSPNGEWVVYSSNETGREEVYLVATDRPARKWQVSTKSGREPAWSPDGATIFYREGDSMMEVGFRPGDRPDIEKPKRLFEVVEVRQSDYRPYDVAPDGRRFVTVIPAREPVRELRVVTGWLDDLAERLE